MASMDRWKLELGGPIGDAISRVLFAPHSNHLLVSSWDSALRLYSLDGSALRLKVQSEAPLLDCCFEDETAALTAGSDGCVRRYDLCSGTEDIVGWHSDSATCIECSQETGQIITASLDKKLMFWDMHTRSANPLSVKTLDVASISVCSMCLLAAIGTDVYMYDLRNLTGPVIPKDSQMEYHIRCIRSSPNWKGYATGSVDGYVAVKYFDHKTDGEMGYVFRCHPKSRNGRSHLVSINDIGIYPDGNNFVTGDNEGYAIVWDAECRKKLFEFPRYPASVASISCNHNGQFLAVASSYTYQEANEVRQAPQIFIERMGNIRRAFPQPSE